MAKRVAHSLWSVQENLVSSERATENEGASVALPALSTQCKSFQGLRARFARTCSWLPYAAPLALLAINFVGATTLSFIGAKPRLTIHKFRISLNPL